MKNRGYTLIELLGVIIILALLTTLVFPSVINSIKKSSDKTDELAMDLVSASADIYIKNNKDLFPKKNGNKFSIDAIVLIDNANLSSKIKLSNGDKIEDKCIQTTYIDGKFKYEIKNKGTCVTEEFYTCKSVDEETVTTGNIPEGNYESGDEYICEVNEGTSYHFFVVSTDGDKINLILDRNINSDGTLSTTSKSDTTQWLSEEDFIEIDGYSYGMESFQGPTTAQKYLDEATKNWKYINNLNESFSDEQGRFDNFEVLGKARFPLIREMSSAGCEFDVDESCPAWLRGSFWLFSSNSSLSTGSSIVSSRSFYYTDYYDYMGVRPVIQITKDDVYYPPVCLLTDTDGDNIADIGEVITCKTENFYVIENNTTTIVMLAEKDLTIPTLTSSGAVSEYPKQSSSSGTITFSDEVYWATVDDSCSAYEGSYKTNSGYESKSIYNENSNLYPYIESYEDYLQSMGVRSAAATLISESQYNSIALRDYYDEEGNFSTIGYSWSAGEYWADTVASSCLDLTSMVAVAGGYERTNYQWYGANFYIRPVINISVDELVEQ